MRRSRTASSGEAPRPGALCRVLLGALLGFAGCGSEPEPGMLRASISLNGGWEAAPVRNPDLLGRPAPDLPYAPVRVPEDLLARADPGVSALWYRRGIDLPEDLSLEGTRAFLRFDKVGHAAVVHLNGRRHGAHFGQQAPFELEVTGALRGGGNWLEVLVHDASGDFVRGRPREDGLADPSIYRPGGPLRKEPLPRNWAGIVGDVSLEIRPDTFVASILPRTSVREQRMEADLEVSGGGDERLWVEATVYDGNRPILELPPSRVRGGSAHLAEDWKDPVLWGVGAHGTPTLYTLRVGLLRGGRVIDRAELRFGFREVWTEGPDVYLNGQKLFLIGTYAPPRGPDWLYENRILTAYRYRAIHSAGFDTVSFHWDRPTSTAYEIADELGMLVLGQLYCHGPLRLRKPDPHWLPFVGDAVRDWVRAYRHHPSIVLWSPLHHGPLTTHSRAAVEWLAETARSADPTRPAAGVDFLDFAAGNDPEHIPGRVRHLGERRPGRPLLNAESWGPLDPQAAVGWLRAAQRMGWFGWIHQHQQPEPRVESPWGAVWPAEPVTGVVPAPASGAAEGPDIGALSLSRFVSEPSGDHAVRRARDRVGVDGPAPLASRYVPGYWIDFGPESDVGPGDLVLWSRPERSPEIAHGGIVDPRGRILISVREAGAYAVRAGGETRELVVPDRDFVADGERYHIERAAWSRLPVR